VATNLEKPENLEYSWNFMNLENSRRSQEFCATTGKNYNE